MGAALGHHSKVAADLPDAFPSLDQRLPCGRAVWGEGVNAQPRNWRRLAGSGGIYARGGEGQSGEVCGGGGGGRIAVQSRYENWVGILSRVQSVTGGVANVAGGAELGELGTLVVVTNQPAGTLFSIR